MTKKNKLYWSVESCALNFEKLPLLKQLLFRKRKQMENSIYIDESLLHTCLQSWPEGIFFYKLESRPNILPFEWLGDHSQGRLGRTKALCFLYSGVQHSSKFRKILYQVMTYESQLVDCAAESWQRMLFREAWSVLVANIAWLFVTTRLDLRVIFSQFLVAIIIPH